MTRKRRADAWDCSLTEAQRWDAYEKSKGLPWQTFAAWVAEEYGLTPGKNALYDWQAFMRTQEGEHRLERAIASRKELKHLADAGALDAKTADTYMALANDAILSGDPEKAARIVAAAVHEETWRSIVRRDASAIATVLNRTVSDTLLNRAFPGRPHLAQVQLRDRATLGRRRSLRPRRKNRLRRLPRHPSGT